MITIVDSGVSNVRSVANMLKKAGLPAEITADPATVARASRLILPGVGAFDAGMRALDDRGLRGILDEQVLGRRVPVLGICLGMQLMARGSAEGSTTGLGWIDADVVRFSFAEGESRKVPHMGWNTARPVRPSPLFDTLASEARFYFTHSYHIRCHQEADVLAVASYGAPFVAAVARGNIWGVQFHPEKSHRFGLALLRNFAAL